MFRNFNFTSSTEIEKDIKYKLHLDRFFFKILAILVPEVILHLEYIPYSV